MRQQAREFNLRLLISLSVPSLGASHRVIKVPHSDRHFCIGNSLDWTRKRARYSWLYPLFLSFTIMDFSAAARLSTRGVMLLKVMWPVDDTLFASVIMALMFEAILSTGNLVE